MTHGIAVIFLLISATATAPTITMDLLCIALTLPFIILILPITILIRTQELLFFLMVIIIIIMALIRLITITAIFRPLIIIIIRLFMLPARQVIIQRARELIILGFITTIPIPAGLISASSNQRRALRFLYAPLQLNPQRAAV